MLRLLKKNKLYIVLILLSACFQLKAQNYEQDVLLLTSKYDFVYNIQDDKPYFHLPQNKSNFVKYNPVTLFFASSMYVYQSLISPQFAASCLYNPSCSQFSNALIRRYGLFKGVFLSADRLTRCNQISATDIHPLKFDKYDHKVHESTDIYSLKHEIH